MELFSPSEKEIKNYDPEVDYLKDLKFWISNEDEILSKVLFPAIKKQKENKNYSDAYQYYIEPLKKCCNMYCKKFDLSEYQDEIFTPSAIVNLAKIIAEEQEKYIKKGDYKDET